MIQLGYLRPISWPAKCFAFTIDFTFTFFPSTLWFNISLMFFYFLCRWYLITPCIGPIVSLTFSKPLIWDPVLTVIVCFYEIYLLLLRNCSSYSNSVYSHCVHFRTQRLYPLRMPSRQAPSRPIIFIPNYMHFWIFALSVRRVGWSVIFPRGSQCLLGRLLQGTALRTHFREPVLEAPS